MCRPLRGDPKDKPLVLESNPGFPEDGLAKHLSQLADDDGEDMEATKAAGDDDEAAGDDDDGAAALETEDKILASIQQQQRRKSLDKAEHGATA